MAIVDELTVEIGGDAKKLKRELDEAKQKGKEFTEQINEANSISSKLNNTFNNSSALKNKIKPNLPTGIKSQTIDTQAELENIEEKKKNINILKDEKKALNNVNIALQEDIKKLKQKGKLTTKENQKLALLNRKLIANNKAITKNANEIEKNNKAIKKSQELAKPQLTPKPNNSFFKKFLAKIKQGFEKFTGKNLQNSAKAAITDAAVTGGFNRASLKSFGKFGIGALIATAAIRAMVKQLVSTASTSLSAKAFDMNTNFVKSLSTILEKRGGEADSAIPLISNLRQLREDLQKGTVSGEMQTLFSRKTEKGSVRPIFEKFAKAQTDSDLISAAFFAAKKAKDSLSRSQLLNVLTGGNIGGMNLFSENEKQFKKELADRMGSILSIDKQNELNAQQVNNLTIETLNAISLGITQLGSIFTDGANYIVNAIQSNSQNLPTNNASTVERGNP